MESSDPTIQDTGKFRKNQKDQFYTNPSVARSCIETVLQLLPDSTDYMWIEPSAGDGSFLHNLPEQYQRMGLDIDPKSEDIICCDYLTWNPASTFQHKTIVFGNPPFGRQSTMAKAFIVKSCKFAEVIAFILPRSFTKPSMNRAFDNHFHCIHTVDLPSNSFRLNNTPYDVPCVFQVWIKKDIPREILATVQPIGFQYVKPLETHHFVFRRVGAFAGKCYPNGGTYSSQSHYFIKLDNMYIDKIDFIREKISQHVFPSNTVGPRSLSKPEANDVINAVLLSF